jgi:hypothetical protein
MRRHALDRVGDLPQDAKDGIAVTLRDLPATTREAPVVYLNRGQLVRTSGNERAGNRAL